MAWSPHTVIDECPNCGRTPTPRFKGLFYSKTRMECECGVSGAWVEYSGRDPWHDAVRGWVGRPADLGPPPLNRKGGVGYTRSGYPTPPPPDWDNVKSAAPPPPRR